MIVWLASKFWIILSYDHMFMSASVYCNRSEDLGGQEVRQEVRQEVQQDMKGKYAYELVHHYSFVYMYFFSVNMLKGTEIIGTGVVMDRETVHGHKLKNDEVALTVESLTDKAIRHHRYKYDVEVNGFTAWNLCDIIVQS